MTCVIVEAPFGHEPGYEVAVFEEGFGAQVIKEDLEADGFQVIVRPGNESSRRFWYLKTNADFDSLWSILGCYFDAYLRFQVTPEGRIEWTESCGCAGCREPIGSDANKFLDSSAPVKEPSGDELPGFGVSNPRWN